MLLFKLSGSLEATVSDFGFARSLEKEDMGQTRSDIGPIRWMAVECLTEKQYSKKSDAWSIAVIGTIIFYFF